MPEVKISTDFLRDIFELSKEVQKETFDFIDKISKKHPSGIPGLNYEKMQNTASGLSIYSARINLKYRALIHEEKNELHLLKIANHDPTYDSVSKIDVLSIMKKNEISVSSKSTGDLGKLFAGLSNAEFRKLGIKTEVELATIRQINTESEYNKLKSEKVFSNIVFDNLDLVLAEFSTNKLVSDYRTRYKRAISILLDNVIEPALNHEDLDPEIKKRVENTKTRLLQKESLEEIVFFYNDALQARSGKTIVEEFRKHKLHAFEDYESEIIRIAKGQ